MIGSRSIFSIRDDSSENWIAIADLMAGLMMVFMLLAIWRSEFANDRGTPNGGIHAGIDEGGEDLPTNGNGGEPPTNGNGVDDPVEKALRDMEERIRKALKNEFKDDFDNWNARLLEGSITIRFLDIPFDRGKSDIKPKFQEILTDFFPRYIKVLHKDFENYIREVRIEGHTSSEWLEIPPTVENLEQYAFIKNMELSQARTRAAMQYVLALSDIAPYEKWVRKKVTANGLSSARLLNSSGTDLQEGETEDRNQSRRVEFAVQVDVLKVLAAARANQLPNP